MVGNHLFNHHSPRKKKKKEDCATEDVIEQTHDFRNFRKPPPTAVPDAARSAAPMPLPPWPHGPMSAPPGRGAAQGCWRQMVITCNL